MALIVESGNGDSTSESYISVADANVFHSSRGNTDWEDIDTPDKESALRRATDFMQQIYRMRWKGTRRLSTQALDWPRICVVLDDVDYAEVPSDEVPLLVKHACAMLALKAHTEDLAPDVDPVVKREKVDMIEIEYGNSVPYKRFRAVDALLAPLLSSSGSNLKVVRA